MGLYVTKRNKRKITTVFFFLALQMCGNEQEKILVHLAFNINVSTQYKNSKNAEQETLDLPQ